ncbi:PGPGW domain-containing protein [Knoellia koreensis]|uniref:Uncharacterized protein n=1 Tax=Knoellia koreensis TaxID=2730921 RepID=A0A849HCL9_9MICO|nr:PGPGW domain-containing protein [Knoellia sp. DB2414S]NNM44434.1 hypothetical protein [Knoellia sp. DB2414S]
MSKLLIVVGAVIAVLGIVLIPLPGPGFLLLALGAVLQIVGLVLRRKA